MKEKKIEAYLVKRVKQLGGEIRKVKWIGRVNCPDRLVLTKCTVPFFCELKATGKRPTRAQFREHHRLRKFGMIVVWFNSIEMIDEYFGV